MRRAPLRPLARPGLPLSLSRKNPCPRDTDCSCLDRQTHPAQSIPGPTPALHMNECYDPDCHEVEQLKALQKSLDHFTDYEHYERCCDGHYHGTRGKEQCCLDPETLHHLSTEPCSDYVEDCEECLDEHKDCYEEIDVYDDDCEQCEVECEELGHEPKRCPQNHPTTRDNCTPACQIENPLLPQLGPTDDFDSHSHALTMMQDIVQCAPSCSQPIQPVAPVLDTPIAPTLFDSEMDHWQTFVQTHRCAPDPCTIGRPSRSEYPPHLNPSFGFTFGCDPTIPANQYPWQKYTPMCNVPFTQPFPTDQFQPHSLQTPPMSQPPNTPQSSAADQTPTDTAAIPPARICEWIMPCGSICGATHARTEDLKRHIKNSHCTKGTVACHWQSCTASFATEAALTGHISKKHLTVSDEDGPWKCTFPGCTKSFMYKQVRDDHVASHNGGNRMHCPICHQWLNCEGSNFRRHMASHGPKNEYMRCRFEGLGCKKRFPRLDNLRRHETCCKFGKKAAGVHHHHHTVHIGHKS